MVRVQRLDRFGIEVAEADTGGSVQIRARRVAHVDDGLQPVEPRIELEFRGDQFECDENATGSEHLGALLRGAWSRNNIVEQARF